MSDYMDLNDLRNNRGYQLLMVAWATQGKEIMASMQKACKLSGKDTTLRYCAGMWAGFDLAVGALDRAIEEVERLEENKKEEISTDELLKKIRDQK